MVFRMYALLCKLASPKLNAFFCTSCIQEHTSNIEFIYVYAKILILNNGVDTSGCILQGCVLYINITSLYLPCLS